MIIRDPFVRISWYAFNIVLVALLILTLVHVLLLECHAVLAAFAGLIQVTFYR